MNEILAIIIGVLGLALGVGAAAKSGEKNRTAKKIQQAAVKATESQQATAEKVREIETEVSKAIKESDSLTSKEKTDKLNEKIKNWNNK